MFRQIHQIRLVASILSQNHAVHQRMSLSTAKPSVPSASAALGRTRHHFNRITYKRKSWTHNLHDARNLVAVRSTEEPVTDIEKLSELAQIRLTEEEKQEMGPQIDRIIEWMGQLNNVDVDGVRPSMRGGDSDSNPCTREDTAWLREDKEEEDPMDVLGRRGVLDTNDDGFVSVPKDVFR
jgi:aspartyl/glutamyl-tRNA(Asn/Gln) amidotransferase C subunit